MIKIVVVCFLGASLAAAQDTLVVDSVQTIQGFTSDSANALGTTLYREVEPLYRPTSTVPPKDTAKASAEKNVPAVASGRILNSTDYISGKLAGERDATGRGIWFFAGLPGVCCYGIGLGGVLCSILIPPSPSEVVLIGKSGEYIMGYTEGYQSKGRWKNAKYASMGCALGTGITAAIYLLIVGSLF
jgi:hypothetical protein